MGPALLVSRLLLAGVFAFAGCAKLADLAGSRQAVNDFGVPTRLAGVVGTLLPIIELTVAVGLVPLFSARYGAVAAAALLGCFIAAIVNSLRQGRSPDCHCFGQAASAPVSWRTVGRNAALLALSAFVVAGGWRHAGVSATHWITHVSGAWLVAAVAGAVIIGLIAFQVWFSLQVLSHTGRTLVRLEALEGSLLAMRSSLGLADDRAVGSEAQPLGHGLESAGGLPVGATAPAFELKDLDGVSHSLTALLAGGRDLMLIFTSAGCGPCEAMMPDLAAWQREHAAQLTIAVVASGDAERNRAKAVDYGITLMLQQSEREVAEAYAASGTPMAVVVGADATIVSPTVGGSNAIATLVAQASSGSSGSSGSSADILQVRSVNGRAPRSSLEPPPPDTSRVGEPAPALVLSGPDGERVALDDLYTEPTVAIFWNPDCGFCERMLPTLQALEQNPLPGLDQLVVISGGSASRTREQGIRSRVLVDPEGEAMRAFDAGGTPMAVRVVDGRIASHVAAGADAVFDLIESTRKRDAEGLRSTV